MQNELLAANLDETWLRSFRGIKALSLDCFDTLFWRKVAEPSDVFYALANHELFRQIGLTATLRMSAERKARRRKWINQHSTEITIEEIYEEALPPSEQHMIAQFVEAELAAEIQHGFIFKPIADLISQAKREGLKVIIVSDIYLSETQLKQMLFSVMPQLEGQIDAVFCSSSYGVSKAGGIWKHVFAQLKLRAAEICHLGDNLEADLRGAQRYGIQATHLIHQAPEIAELLDQRKQIGVQLLPELRHDAPIPSYFHAQFASRKEADAASTLGYVSLGPILYAFAEFILDEIRQLESAGKRVKTGFLLRDGFLPAKACAALQGEPVGHYLNISRFTSIAASLDSEQRVMDQLANTLGPDSIPALIRQFLLPKELAQKITRLVERSPQPEQEFTRFIQQKDTLKTIFKNSLAFRKRLIRHIQRMTGVESGDTLMFVDLGYSGTAQTQLQDILKKELNVDLVGRYLIAAEVPLGQADRKGLVDPAWADNRITSTLTGQYIAAFEMMCTQTMPSTVDYTDEGEPVFAKSVIDKKQHLATDKIQGACLEFIEDQRLIASYHRPAKDRRDLAHSAAIDLARFLYFPVRMEVDCLNDFQFDMNLGTDMKMSLIDVDSSLKEMRQMGFLYMHADLKSVRMNYPMELRYLDISLSTLLFAQNRYGFGIAPANASFRQESVQILVANETQHIVKEIIASSTFDGFFSLLIPASNQFNVAVLFGRNYTWMQLDTVEITSKQALHKAKALKLNEDVVLDKMQVHEGGLYTVDENGLLFLPGIKESGSELIYRIIFRPIAYRDKQEIIQEANNQLAMH